MSASTPALLRVRLPRRSRTASRGLGLAGNAALATIALLVLLALAAPLLAPADPNVQNLGQAFAGPSSAYPLGADESGRDLLSRLLYGGRTGLLGPLLVVLLSTVLGGTVAFASAWIGGRFDAFCGRVLDVMFAFPGLLLAILAVALFGRGLAAASIALGIAYTPYLARLIRSAVVRERALPYVVALEVQGLSALRICVRHLLPNVLPLVAAQAALTFGSALVDLAALSFLGLGVQPPTADWGAMVASGLSGVIAGEPREALLAGGAIVLSVVAFNVLGERLVDLSERRR